MNDISIDPSSIAITLITYYPKWYRGKLQSIKHTDKIRGDLSLEFINTAKKLGYQVVIVDSKSSKTYQQELGNIPAITVMKSRRTKRAPNRRSAFKKAAQLPGVKVIFSTEAEKISILDSVNQLTMPILEDKVDIVVPRRKDDLFKATYPLYMYESETEGNNLYNQHLRLHNYLAKNEADLDMYFGPRVFRNNPKILALFMKRIRLKIPKMRLPKDYYDVEEFSNTMFFPIVLALKKKIRVMSMEIPFLYPKIQKENEEIGEIKLFVEKRKAQRLSMLLDVMYFLNSS